MHKSSANSAIGVALAWPETKCKQAGAWYDGIMSILGFNQFGYYTVGHAATLLIATDGSCFYFDFGRYHTPAGSGRVRDAIIDEDLIVSTKAVFSEKNEIQNLKEILIELQQNESCHGSGILHAATCKINFDKAYQKAKQMQAKQIISYGPFIWCGTNCSRFVRIVLLAGILNGVQRIKLTFPYSITPTPLSNILAIENRAQIKKAATI